MNGSDYETFMGKIQVGERAHLPKGGILESQT